MHTSQDEARNKTLLGKSGCNEQSCMITSHDLHAPVLITTRYINHSLYKHQSWLPMCWLTVYFYIRSINFKVPCLTVSIDQCQTPNSLQRLVRARCAVLATQKEDASQCPSGLLGFSSISVACERGRQSLHEKKKKKGQKALCPRTAWLLVTENGHAAVLIQFG